nr:MAG: putative maturation protein [Leviviridae sp.]
MPVRSRTSGLPFQGGGYAIFTYNRGLVFRKDQGQASPYVHSRCDDVVGEYGGEHPLLVDSIDSSGIVPITGINSPYGPDTSWREYHFYLPDYVTQSPPSHLLVSLDSEEAVATKALALTNPSRPSVAMPNFLYELKDLPGMIRDIGKLKHLAQQSRKGWKRMLNMKTAKELANLQLSEQMGWEPLVSDLQNILGFQADVDKRIAVLDRIFNQNGGLHRTIGKPGKVRKGSFGGTSWGGTASTSFSIPIDSTFEVLWVQSSIKTTTNRWASCRWRSSSLPGMHLSDQDLARQARALVFGSDITTKEVWDAVPWTWLVDWFANVGDFLQAFDNSIPCICPVACVMTHQATTETWVRTDGAYYYAGGNGTRTAETKRRTLQAASLTASIPFLSGRQFSILGALAIQRKR